MEQGDFIGGYAQHQAGVFDLNHSDIRACAQALRAKHINVLRAAVAQPACPPSDPGAEIGRDTSELQSLMRISYAVFCLKKKTTTTIIKIYTHITIHTHSSNTSQAYNTIKKIH